MLANLITYASADILLFINSGKSYLMTFLTNPDLVDERYAAEAVEYFMLKTARECTPFHTFFEQSFDADGMGIFVRLIRSPESVSADLGNTLSGHMSTFSYDIAVSMLSNFVFFSFLDIKDKFCRRDNLAVSIGVWMSVIYWILASNTFATCLVRVLERRVSTSRQIFLHLGIVVFAIAFEVVVHAYAKKCKVIPLVLFSSLKLITGFFRALLTWLILKNIFADMQILAVGLLFVFMFVLLIFEKKMLDLAETSGG